MGDDVLAVLVVTAAGVTLVTLVWWLVRLGRDAWSQHETDDERFNAVLAESVPAGLSAVLLLAPVAVLSMAGAAGLAIVYLVVATVVLGLVVIRRRWNR